WRVPYFFFFNDTATTEISPLSLHDALPIWYWSRVSLIVAGPLLAASHAWLRSEEHTSELQSPCNLVCRLLLEKKESDDDRKAPRMTATSREMTGQRPARR